MEKPLKTNINLVPDIVNPSCDYYCTWQTQLYATSDGKPVGQRAILGEKALFNKEKPFGWAYFFEQARKDLIFVMDDSWDVPINGDNAYFGSLILNREKFPKAVANSKNNEEALKSLSDRIKGLGWKGLGGWVCAQESKLHLNSRTQQEYWTERLKEADRSGFVYWKVDWGNKFRDIEFRKMLTELGKKHAPNLVIEHAGPKEIIPSCDVYRTYDVPAVMSVPMTMEKLKDVLAVKKVEKDCLGLINCEDEVYIAAAGGFIMGVMRHPFSGAFINGKADMSFPYVHRDLKTKMYEVIRAVRWHRIAPAFGADIGSVCIDSRTLKDSWRFVNNAEEFEEWWFNMPSVKDFINDGIIVKGAPAAISRNCQLPKVSEDKNGNIPYVVAAGNPNGAFSVATLGRTIDRQYFIPRCDVTVNIGDSKVIAAFGEYGNLILQSSHFDIKRVLMQDLADESAYDITDMITVCENKIIIKGELISKIGTISQPSSDTSEPGVIIKLN